MFLACRNVAVHCIASGAPDPTERPNKHLAPGASAGSSAHNQRHPDLKTITAVAKHNPRTAAPDPLGKATRLSRQMPGPALRALLWCFLAQL
jgi:hypothetical protein